MKVKLSLDISGEYYTVDEFDHLDSKEVELGEGLIVYYRFIEKEFWRIQKELSELWVNK